MHFYAFKRGKPPYGLPHKILVAMKITTILLLAFNLTVSAASFAQQINLSEKNAKLADVLKTIRQQSGYDIVYRNDQIDGKTITIDIKAATIEQALKTALQGQHLSYTIQDGTIILKAEENGIGFLDKIKAAIAQITVQGKVQDETGSPLLGVNVAIKGTSQSVPTDKGGAFRITVPDNNSILVFSYIGYETQELKAKDIQSGSTIILKASNTNLKEVIVNKGFYTERAELSTSATAKITAKDIEEQPITSVVAALQGRLPGVDITQKSGVPGKNINLQIRGTNSIANGSNPMYIIDGVPFYASPSPTLPTFDNLSIGSGFGGSTDPLASFDPAQIESIEVLKDADATAIYGTRGANGVILITTKKGKAGSSKVNLSITQGIGKATRIIELLNTQQYLALRHQAFKNDGVAIPPSNAYDINGAWDTTRYTNWPQLAIGGTAHYTDVQSAFSGGTDQIQYIIDGGYHKETTVFPGNSGFQRGAIHGSINHSSTNRKFQLSFSTFGSFTSNLTLLLDPSLMMTLPPDAPAIFNADGSLNWANSTWSNPYADLLRTNRSSVFNITNGLNLKYELIKGLSLTGNFGYTLNYTDQLQKTPISAFNPANTTAQSTSSIGSTNTKSWLFEPQINYHKELFGGKIDVLLGGSLQQQLQTYSAIKGTGYANDALLENIPAASTITVLPVGYIPYKYQTAHFRVGYSYQDKYVLNLTGSHDGSSRFGENRRFANFGSVGAAWVFSNESFVKGNISFLSFGKLRASYGITGNDQIGDYQFLNTYNPYTTATYFGSNSLSTTNLPNPSFGWETTQKAELGLELSFLNDRVFFIGDYYRNTSSNQLVNYTLPSFTGGTGVLENFPATIRNSGLEMQLKTANIKRDRFSWNTSFNLSIPLEQGQLIDFPGFATSTYATSYRIGQSVNTILNRLHSTGVNPQTGVYTYQDYNNDGSISTFTTSDGYLGFFTGRQYYGGFQNNFRLGNWELNAFIYFAHQQYGLNFFNARLPGSMNNIPLYVYQNMWKQPGDNALFQKASNSNSVANSGNANVASSDMNYSDASYIRLKNVSLSYNFPSKIINALHVRSLKAYCQAQNLFTVTRLKEIDPETQSAYAVPPIRMTVVGLQLGF